MKFAKIAFGHGSVTSKPKHVTIANKSKTTPATFTGIGASGDFALSNGCGPTIAPKGKCRVVVTFTPTALGTRSGTLTVNSNAINSSVGVPLSGLGVAPK